MPFLNELVVRIVPNGQYQLVHKFVYQHKNGGLVVVPSGFETDFASIPQGFRWLVTGHDNTRKPAVVHDFLCRAAQNSKERKQADKIFKEAMKEAGVPWWKRQLCYSAVRVFSILGIHE